MAMAPSTARARHPWPPPTPTPHNTTPHHTPKFTKNIQKIWPGTTQKQQKIEENHVLWHPWAIPGHSWVLLGRPRWSKGEKVTKNVVRDPPSRDLFWSTFPSIFFSQKSALLERVFLRIAFLSIFPNSDFAKGFYKRSKDKLEFTTPGSGRIASRNRQRVPRFVFVRRLRGSCMVPSPLCGRIATFEIHYSKYQ